MTRLALDRRGIPALIAVILLIAFAAYGHLVLAAEINALNRRAEAMRAETATVRAEAADLAADRDTVAERRETLAAMNAAGFMRPQDRLGAAQAIEALAAAHGLLRLRADIAPEETASRRPPAAGEVVAIATPVSVSVVAPDMASALAFLDALPDRLSGIATVESATLRRQDANPANAAARVTGEIALVWHTVRTAGPEAELAAAR